MSDVTTFRSDALPAGSTLYGRVRPLMSLIAAAFQAATALDQRRLPERRALETLGLDADRVAAIRFR
ncbi:hypothetical protein [Methylobrevis albus]|uniref:Uncharacterized protein n=1 Tax=Methylobrevis albus TaxID=2793297 RepID=A0A931I4P0_9HYPH|nr:hypothetical protein [Methylobrevis albus]MBH0238806.1 hypothetical protein [Methylobrevis albus]